MHSKSQEQIKAELRALAKRNDTYENIFMLMAFKPRSRKQIDIRRFKERGAKNGIKLDDTLYMQFWEDLAPIGVGILKHRRNGVGEKFDFEYACSSIGQAALDDSKKIELKAPYKRPTLPRLEQAPTPAPVVVMPPKPVSKWSLFMLKVRKWFGAERKRENHEKEYTITGHSVPEAIQHTHSQQ